ncbi:uncharacterized protein LOC141904643 [Tubulanus polymorphus]|uniref:uncharacterized protein LOC141904643 n=1 Tax=Tubulanus polymorphus TaxID=672921 RepID=UPI003DA48C77
MNRMVNYCIINNYMYLVVLFLISDFSSVTGEVFDGTNLSCYTCKDAFKLKFNAKSECLFNLSDIDVIRCGKRDKYCKVERQEVQGVVINIERGCADKCYWGCRYNGFGLTYLRCTSCCNQAEKCNTGNTATRLMTSLAVIVVCAGALMLRG